MTRTESCVKGEDYDVLYVLSLRDLVFRPDLHVSVRHVKVEQESWRFGETVELSRYSVSVTGDNSRY